MSDIIRKVAEAWVDEAKHWRQEAEVNATCAQVEAQLGDEARAELAEALDRIEDLEILAQSLAERVQRQTESLARAAEAVRLPEADRQCVILALANLSIERPGWDVYLASIAEKFRCRAMYERLRETSK